MLISETYRELNRELHSHGKYGLSGYKWAKQVDKLARSNGAKTVLDYGCGRGTLKIGLMEYAPLPYSIIEYDPAIKGKEEKPARADLVVCGDVLEHIEPECLYAVLDDIANTARVAVFLVVATVPAVKTLADGRNAHLIVESADWWLPKLMLRWRLSLFRDLGGEFLMVGTPK
jgi:hypothetical protein